MRARWHGLCSFEGMTLLYRRFIGALMLDAGAFEDIEAGLHSGVQSMLVVVMACVACGFAGMALGVAGFSAMLSGSLVALGAWLVWAGAIVTIGTGVMAEPQTRSNTLEVLRVLGYASAPGVFAALAAIRPAAPLVLVVVSLWMIAAAVIGVRQALDYRSTTRAVALCIVSWLLAIGSIAAFLAIFTRTLAS